MFMNLVVLFDELFLTPSESKVFNQLLKILENSNFALFFLEIDRASKIRLLLASLVPRPIDAILDFSFKFEVEDSYDSKMLMIKYHNA